MIGSGANVSLLTGFRAAQLGAGAAVAVAGRLLADAGAEVTALDADRSTPMLEFLNRGKPEAAGLGQALAGAQLIVTEGGPGALAERGHDAAALGQASPDAAIVLISNFGQTGPKADDPATDLTLFCASGMARLLTGQVDDISEPPVGAVGGQAAIIGGAAAACAGMAAALAGRGAVVDVSLQEALATLAMTELTRGGQTGQAWSRRRLKDGNGATVTILPARDGFVAISPREERQWAAWLDVMGAPDWGRDPRFARKADRVEHWDALHGLMSAWSRDRGKREIAAAAQAAHVPSFPLMELHEHLASPQLAHREFFQSMEIAGDAVQAPSAPYALTFADGGGVAASPASGGLPLAGVRVLDFSWVIAGPTATRHLAALGAEVIKVEAPGRGDPGRGSELHTVLGQAKQAIVLDLKRPDAVEIAKALAAKSDIVIENFATGVMDRLGLSVADLLAVNPNLICLSASGMGRTGPEAGAVAYGTLLQSYAGFAGLNRHPDRPPRIGFAWLDPMCGLLLPFLASAALWRRRQGGGGVHIDFSMIEAMLWTLAAPLLELQLGRPAAPVGNGSNLFAPHGVYPAQGDDAWVGLAVTTDDAWRRLCALVPELADRSALDRDGRVQASKAIDDALARWSAARTASAAEAALRQAGVPTAALATSTDLVADPHLSARQFWEKVGDGVLPGLPWRASFGRQSGPAPAMGGDTDDVLSGLLGLEADRLAALRAAGAIA